MYMDQHGGVLYMESALAKIPQDMGGLTIKTKDFGGGQAAEQKQWTRHGPIESSYSARSYYNNCTLNSTDLREGEGRQN